MSAIYQIYGHRLASDFQFKTKLLPGDGMPDLTFTQATSPPPYEEWTTQTPILDTGTAQLYACDTYDILHVTDLIDYYIFEDQVIAYLLDEQYDYQVEVYLLGLILSYWLEKRGIRAFHASAVNLQGEAIGFLATNAGGKSSLSATLAQLGHPLLTDDVLAVQAVDGQFMAASSFPQMRMWPHVAEHFVGEYEHLELAHPQYDKRRVPAHLIGDFCDSSIPLKCLFLPERVEDSEAKVTIERVPAGLAMMNLLTNSFAIRILEYETMRMSRFQALGQLVQTIPVYKLSYPSGMELLPEVCQEIVNQIS